MERFYWSRHEDAATRRPSRRFSALGQVQTVNPRTVTHIQQMTEHHLRLQSPDKGGIAQRARKQAVKLANDPDVRMSPPKVKPPQNPAGTTTATASQAIPAGTSRDSARTLSQPHAFPQPVRVRWAERHKDLKTEVPELHHARRVQLRTFILPSEHDEMTHAHPPDLRKTIGPHAMHRDSAIEQ